MLLLLLIYPFLELYFLIQVGARFGIVNTLFALVAIGIIGAGLARTQGRYILSSLQASISRGEIPTDTVLHGLLVFVSGVLFLIPGFLSDVAALVLLLPGGRHLMVAWLRARMARQMRAGKFRVFTFGRGAGSTPRSRPSQDEAWTREVSPKVIDVTPVSSESHQKKSDEP